jgi:N-terminal acetyltransferase B complex non-catalytic subunit
MDFFTENVLTVIHSVADSESTISARLWVDQHIEQISELLDRNEQICLDFRYASHYAMSRIFQGVSAFEIDLSQLLKDRLNSLENFRFVAPASEQVLHTLYVTYEIATSVLRLDRYLTRTGSGELRESLKLAERLINMVIEQSSAIKKSLDEGGWIDRVLKSVFQGDLDVEDTTSIPGTLKAVVDENFMEEWAGQVVDSWKDSVKGFAYFKAGC